jgi:amino acid transporter
MATKLYLINVASIVGIVIASFFVRTTLPLWALGVIALGTLVFINIVGYRGLKKSVGHSQTEGRSKVGLVAMFVIGAIGILLVWLSNHVR